jgi:Zn-finger nucleic acid-binding protein
MIFPKCKVPMLVVEFEKVEVDHCIQCRGTWFDRGELALLFEDLKPEAHGLLPEQIAALPEAESREEQRKCPICRKSMRKVLVGPAKEVLIDACLSGDGLWFDDAEVADLARQIADSSESVSQKAIEFIGKMFRKDNEP